MLNKTIRFFLENKLVAYLLLLLFVGVGLATAPFDFGIEAIPRTPVSVDAIPDIGENQQIIYTQWNGRSPQDVEDQITYPLTTALFGIPGVKSIRSNSMFGFSSIYVIFDENIEFYWSRSRILEKLNSLPGNTLPEGVQPTLGPDATALGQIFWYTLEGRNESGEPSGGWDLQELRSIQDYYVRYGLSGAEGVAEVASIGGFVKEYQVDVDPEAMKVYNINLEQVMNAVKGSNIDVGAQTIEINFAEYFVRGLGYVKKIEDIENSVVSVRNNVPIRISDIAKVNIAPATRRGVLDKSGAEAVGGVVIARYGSNPLEVINNVKSKIAEIEPGLPSKTLADGSISKINIIPFYDRTQLIKETIGTLQEALNLEILITIIVVILMLMNLKSSLLVSSSLPVAVLMCFIAMKYFGVDANIVALSGIAIAIGTMVDMGIVLIESMVKRINEARANESLLESIYEATTEVSSAVITAVATTIISFLPVFTMEASEGKLFRPLAFTKTFALVASIIVAITLIPPIAHTVFSIKSKKKLTAFLSNSVAVFIGFAIFILYNNSIGALLILLGVFGLIQHSLQHYSTESRAKYFSVFTNIIYAGIVAWILASIWMPLGVNKSTATNFMFIAIIAGGIIALFGLLIYFYENILRFLLRFKLLFLLVVSFLLYQGFIIYQETGEEFMPALDEGSFLLMPTSMPHSGMQENIKNLRLLDMAVTSIPEVETVVGKAGRVNSALDPAPMSMYENVILYKSEYKTDENGHRIRFKYKNGEYIRDKDGALIPDKKGRYFRQWRDHINDPDDIWQEIVQMTKLPGVTSAPKLQPIETRLVMLQTGMRAPMGIKVKGADLKTIESFGLELENYLKEVEGVKEAAVFADRIVGKPYLLLEINRETISRYGLSVAKVQQYIQAAIGGMTMTTTVEGRERYAIRIRYPRELRNDPNALKRIYIPGSNNEQIPLAELVEIKYEQGAQSIKSEDGFLIGYVLFDRQKGYSEVEVVKNAQNHFESLISDGTLDIPPGISYQFAGNYEQQVRASKRLNIVVPVALLIILLILYFQFKSIMISMMVFTGVFIAFAGGFIMIGLYDTSWFLDFEIFDTNMRDLFQIRTINLSVAVWVGFLALFGIATDDGVLVATFLKDSFMKNQPNTIKEVRDAVVEGGLRRVRPAMMTTATTILALLPILTSTGRGSDIMLPMAIPSFGGMTLQMITMFTVPILFSLWKEMQIRLANRSGLIFKNRSLLIFAFVGIVGLNNSSAQSLSTLESKLVANNLELKALQNQYLASVKNVKTFGQLPDPELGLGTFPLPVETRLGAQTFRFSATQMFPWFGTLDKKTDLENAKTHVLNERVKLKQLELLHDLRVSYYQLYELIKKHELTRSYIDIFETLEELVLNKVENGKANLADALRVQLKLEELKQELVVLEESKTGPIVTINQLLNKRLDSNVSITDSLSFSMINSDKDSLINTIRNTHPIIKMISHEQSVSKEALLLNKLDGLPSFGAGMDYIIVNQREDFTHPDNGRDILQFRVNVQVPINRTKYNAKEQSENLKIEGLEYEKTNQLKEFEKIIEKIFSQYQTAKLKYDLYQKQIEITNMALNILQSKYSSTGEGFDELLYLKKDLLDYEIKKLETVVKSHLLKADIEKLLFANIVNPEF